MDVRHLLERGGRRNAFRSAVLLGLALLLMGTGPAGEGTTAIIGPESPYVSGRVPFSLEVGREEASRIDIVVWYLDGRQVQRSTAPPYRVVIDLGPAVLPHRITARAFTDTSETVWAGEYRTRGLSVAYNDRVALVVVPVTVMHPDGWFQTGLQRSDFRVYEDGEEQPLKCFSADVVPVNVGLLIDASDSMRGNVREIRKAARSFIARLSPEDRATVMSFNHDLVRHCSFTGDRAQLFGALETFRPGGGTALYDSLYGATRAFRQDSGKRVIILFTDGQDEKYRRPAEARRRMERAVSAAARANITVYTIGLGRDVDHEKLAYIAETTGGAVFRLERIRDLAETYDRIFEELGSQYTLCYRPRARDEEAEVWRRIRVEVERPGLIVRHKKGYLPSR